MFEGPDLTDAHSTKGDADQTLAIDDCWFHRSITAQKSAREESAREESKGIQLLGFEGHENCGAELWC